MAEECEGNTQTQTQNSQIEWSEPVPSLPIPIIWGRLYSIAGKHCWRNEKQNPEYYGTYEEYKFNVSVNL